MNYRSVSILIPAFNGRKILEKFFPSVAEAATFYKGETEIIIVDDGGTDGSEAFIKDKFPQVRYLRWENNIGALRATNRGFGFCRNDIIILLDNDVSVTDDFIVPLIPHFDDQDVFGVRPGLCILNTDVNGEDLKRFSFGLKLRAGFIELPMIKVRETQKQNFIFLLGGCSAAFSRNKLLQLGGYDELFSPFYWEDADLSYRAWKRRWKIIYEPKSVVYHQPHSTIFEVYPKHYIERITERNKYILVWKNISDRKLLLHHFACLPFRLWRLLLKGEWWRLSSFLLALSKLRKIREKRKCELREAKISDAQLFSLFSEIMKGSIPWEEREAQP